MHRPAVKIVGAFGGIWYSAGMYVFRYGSAYNAEYGYG